MPLYRIVNTDKARLELKKEIQYSVENWGVAYAKKHKQNIAAIIQGIARNPHMYAIKPFLGGEVRSVDYKSTRIVYRVKETEKMVEVLGFPSVHQRKNDE